MKCHVTYKTPTYAKLKKQFDWVWDGYKTVKFEPSDETDGEREFEYVRMDKTSSSQEVYEEIEKQGSCPATFEELVSFAAAFPEEQKKYPIIALGSPFTFSDGYRRVPCLGWFGGERNLSANWLGSDWSSGNRFLVVRKSTKTLGNSDSISRELLIRACKAFVSVLEEDKTSRLQVGEN